MRIRQNLIFLTRSVSLLVLTSAFVGILQNPPVQAKCIRNPFTGKQVCNLTDLDPTPGIPGSREVAEQAWGEAGSSAYQAAASAMRGRNGGSQGLDEVQKKYLRPHFGDLVDRVAIIYGARMLDQWSAFGKEINLSGVDTAAQTYCNRIYVRDSYKPNDFQQLVTLSHEMTHSKQCEQLGGEGKFGFHYFREFKRAGQNYENNKLEQEAYSFANQFASSLSSTSSSSSPAQKTDSSSFHLTCRNISINSNILSAQCDSGGGSYVTTSIGLRGIWNRNGTLQEDPNADSSSFQLSCRDSSIQGNVLSASCDNGNGAVIRSQLRLGRIWNDHGTLRY